MRRNKPETALPPWVQTWRVLPCAVCDTTQYDFRYDGDTMRESASPRGGYQIVLITHHLSIVMHLPASRHRVLSTRSPVHLTC